MTIISKTAKHLIWFLLLASILGCSIQSPQTVIMKIGSFKRVANGKAELWLGQIDKSWRADLGGLVDCAQIELKVGDQTYALDVYTDKFTEPVAGIRVRLVRIFESSMGASLEISWTTPMKKSTP